MSSRPLVSVIIPCYNASQWISTTIKSVERQTYENVEIIAVDDGSTDDTVEILHESDFDHIQVLENEKNRGIPETKNKGIKYANGDIIAFLDQDDYWISRKIERQVNIIMEEESTGVVYSDMYLVGDDGCPVEYKSSRNPPNNEVFDHFYMGNVPCYNVTKVVTKRCFEEIGNLDSEFFGADDQDFDLRVAKSPKFQFEYIPEPLVLKRTHNENASGEFIPMLDDLIKLAHKHSKNLRNENLESERLSDLYARRAFRYMQKGNKKEALADVHRSLHHNVLEPKTYFLMPAFFMGPFRKMFLKLLQKTQSKLTKEEYTKKIEMITQ